MQDNIYFSKPSEAKARSDAVPRQIALRISTKKRLSLYLKGKLAFSMILIGFLHVQFGLVVFVLYDVGVWYFLNN